MLDSTSLPEGGAYNPHVRGASRAIQELDAMFFGADLSASEVADLEAWLGRWQRRLLEIRLREYDEAVSERPLPRGAAVGEAEADNRLTATGAASDEDLADLLREGRA